MCLPNCLLFFPIFPLATFSWALSSDPWTILAGWQFGKLSLFQNAVLGQLPSGEQSSASHRKRAFKLQQGERTKALALLCGPDRISQVGGRFVILKTFRAKEARLSVTKSLLDERAVNHQGSNRGRPWVPPPGRPGPRRAACLKFRGASRAGHRLRGNACYLTLTGVGN